MLYSVFLNSVVINLAKQEINMTIIRKEYKGQRDISGDLEIATFIKGNTLSLNQAKHKHRPGYSKYFELVSRVRQFCNLPLDWDSYGADRINQFAIDSAFQVIERLAIDGLLSTKIDINVFPMRDGGIQFEFDDTGISFELEISPYRKFNFIEYDEEGNVIVEYENFSLSELKEKLVALDYA